MTGLYSIFPEKKVISKGSWITAFPRLKGDKINNDPFHICICGHLV